MTSIPLSFYSRWPVIVCVLISSLVMGCSSSNDDSTPELIDVQDDGLQLEVDWRYVESSNVEQAARALYQLLRRLDYWHHGQTPVIAVEIRADGSAIDHDGHTIYFGLPEWKKMVTVIEAERNDYRIRAMPSELYTDGLGEVKRHLYIVRVEHDSRLLFELAN